MEPILIKVLMLLIQAVIGYFIVDPALKTTKMFHSEVRSKTYQWVVVVIMSIFVVNVVDLFIGFGKHWSLLGCLIVFIGILVNTGIIFIDYLKPIKYDVKSNNVYHRQRSQKS